MVNGKEEIKSRGEEKEEQGAAVVTELSGKFSLRRCHLNKDLKAREGEPHRDLGRKNS